MLVTETPAASPRRRRRWPWILGGVLVVLLAVIAAVALPIVLHAPQGSSGQGRVPAGEFPTEVTATGDDDRTRTLSVTSDSGDPLDLSAVSAGNRLVVTGSGYDGERGIYVAVCAVPDELDTKPGPCLGGVGSQDEQQFEEGVVQYAPSNWINETWAWRLFGSRSYDDNEAGTFTAYIELPPVTDGKVDCAAVQCGLYTRNDHTAASDRVQDLYVPLRWAD
ncbi:MAG: hypothetical protein RL499_198 [Actinomycetota bacterium]